MDDAQHRIVATWHRQFADEFGTKQGLCFDEEGFGRGKTANELIFADRHRSAEECHIYESLKMRLAAEVIGNQKYYFGPRTKLPDGFTVRDLSVLTLWFLIPEGRRGVSEYLEKML